MKPVNFEDANCVFKAPNCGDLPAVKTDKSIVSCWEMTEKEREEFLKTGKIYLLVMGQAQPPVALYVDRPIHKTIERRKIMQELKQQLIGQKEGMQCALDELMVVAKSLENRIKCLDEEIEKIGE